MDWIGMFVGLGGGTVVVAAAVALARVCGMF